MDITLNYILLMLHFVYYITHYVLQLYDMYYALLTTALYACYNKVYATDLHIMLLNWYPSPDAMIYYFAFECSWFYIWSCLSFNFLYFYTLICFFCIKLIIWVNKLLIKFTWTVKIFKRLYILYLYEFNTENNLFK